jgi:hypothetical protein
MSAPARCVRPHRPAPPIDILTVRAETRAYLWSIGVFASMAAAVDPLEEYAHASGLVRELGQDFCQQIISAPFEKYQCGEARLA